MNEENTGGETQQEETAGSASQSQTSGNALGVPGAIVLGSALVAASIYFGLAGVGGGSMLAANTGDSVPNQPAAQPSGTETPPAGPVDIEAGDLPILGDPDAPILVVEWSDYQCPFCKRAFDDAVTQIRDEYVDTGKVAFAYRDFAFLGQASNDGAGAARCAAEQGKFWEFHDELWAQHPGSGHGDHLTAAALKATGASLGLDTTQFNDCVDSNKYADAVLADTAAGRSAGVNGTPTTFVNGRVINGAQPYSAFKQLIDDELAKVE